MSDSDELLGYCGLYCGNCLYYQNTAKGISTDPGDGTPVDCKGCNSGSATPWCTVCEIKRCNREKGTRYCLKCSDFPCGIISGFIDDPKFPYHKDVPYNMKRLLETGLDAWSREMDEKYTCEVCKKKFSYFDERCPDCK